MINFVYGTYGSGKSSYILNCIKKDIEAGQHIFLIVPDQEAVQTERATLYALPNSAQLNLEVVSFSRLYNRLCREYGGLEYRYITPPIRHLLMWQNLRELTGLLEEFKDTSERDSSICDVLLSTISELKASAITPDMLERTAQKIENDPSLSARLRDIALIYTSYDRLVSESYSDSSDDLARLYDILKKEHFFKGKSVYIDSFTSFTAAEHRIIERLFADADNVTVSIPIPHPDFNDISVKSIKNSQSRLLHSARMHGEINNVILSKNKRALSPSLGFVAENLWRLDLNDEHNKIFNDGSITVEICDTPYAEAEAVSNRILELLREGERCKDMLVLMRSPDKYKGIIEPAFEKNGIPYYFAQKTDLNSIPPVKLLFSALRIRQYNWQKNDIISHVKTGLYPISKRSCDLFEEYVNTWNIRGKQFTDTEGWTMNPDGYSDKLSERGKDILISANEVRQKLISTLEKFFIMLDSSESIADMCRAVYGYFTDIDLEATLNELALTESERGNLKSAKELKAIYGIMLNTLADIAAALPDTEVTVDEFALILKTVFDRTEVGTIPTSVDEVTVGSAATLRASNPKYTFVMGLCEGEFPLSINDSGLFTSTDRSRLTELGIELASDSDTKASDELMYAHRAFASPSCGLFVSTYVSEFSGQSKNPSICFNRLLSLFKDYKPHRYSGNDLHYTVGAPRTAVSHINTVENDEEREALKIAVTEHIANAKRVSELPISAGEYTLDSRTVDRVFGTTARFSSTKFENYISCPFSYYCTHVLDLREKINSDFLSSDMGNFVHKILEEMVGFATTPNSDGELPTDEEITQKTENAVLEYIEKISPSELKRSQKLSHVYRRLKDLALLMVRNIASEFKNSDFVPEFFELSIDGKGNNPPPMEFILNDGFKLSFTGKIDRVDIYKNGERIYVRVIDYKTGTKVFSLDDVEHGINTQMLLYLFMLCKTPDTAFCKELGLSDGDTPIPAGVMYLSANLPTIQSLARESEDKIKEKAEDSLKRSGLLLGSEEILTAMNHQLSKKVLAGVYKKKSGELTGDALTSAEEFEDLYRQITDTVEKISVRLKNGDAGATPLRYGKKDPCSYCKMKSVCRKD